MQRIYEEAKTPFKYGVALPAPSGKKVDCPNVFRHGGRWVMVHVQFENDPEGSTTQLAVSDDLLRWKPLGAILERGASNAWDFATAAGGGAVPRNPLSSGNGTSVLKWGSTWACHRGRAGPGV